MTREGAFIGDVSRQTGLSIHTIRFYEAEGLLREPSRTESGYRVFSPHTIDQLQFIRKAQALGLSLEDVRELLRVADKGTPPCEHVRATLAHRLRADAHRVDQPAQDRFTGRDQVVDCADRRGGQTGHADGTTCPDRLAEAQAVAAQLTATGQRISRRALRQAGIHGSNADLGLIARILKLQTTKTPATADTG